MMQLSWTVVTRHPEGRGSPDGRATPGKRGSPGGRAALVEGKPW